MTNQKYQVAFRQGGRERFRWSKVLQQYPTRQAALEDVKRLMAQGTWALVQPLGASLPDTYSPDQSVEEVVTREDGWTYTRA